MNIEALERLARLRDSGVLTQEEFERQKADLLASEPDANESGDTSKSRWGFWLALIGVPAVLLTVVVVNWGPTSLATSSDEQTSSIWNVERSTNPLTDQEVVTATARFEAAPFLVDTAIKCEGGTRLTYEISTYDQDGSGAPLKTREVDGTSVGTFTMRAGDGKALNYINFSPKYSNTVSMTPASEGNGVPLLSDNLAALSFLGRFPDSVAAGKADRLILSLPLTTGEAVVTIDQTASTIRNILDACSEVEPVPSAVASEPAKLAEDTVWSDSQTGYLSCLIDGETIAGSWKKDGDDNANLTLGDRQAAGELVGDWSPNNNTVYYTFDGKMNDSDEAISISDSGNLEIGGLAGGSKTTGKCTKG